MGPPSVPGPAVPGENLLARAILMASSSFSRTCRVLVLRVADGQFVSAAPH
ncbi:hypothetical protein SLI_4962 [Streptomyces lividans 1326]|uniref:Uncharacterized protein n=1 Tax=Streptomyces lividans 1326 TaxID=1200984 RepID=A0A7U9DWA3_STRLI|nr:hypothetical protein SLI_4962 [Streptomyces lividans 1326]